MTAIAASFVKPRALIESSSIDWTLITVCFALISIGVVMVASASVTFASTSYGDAWFFAKRQLVYLSLGFCCALVVACIPMTLWQRYGGYLLLLAIFLLIVVLIPGIGRKVNGSQRWLAFGSFTIQASEVVKFCSVIFFAGFFARRQAELQEGWRGFIKPVALVALLALLLLLEPDFGSTVVLSATVVAMLFLAGVKIWQFLLLVLTGVSGLVLIAVLSPYRLQRLVTYLDPWADQFNSGYQLTQSLIAFGRGEWFGVGLGNSVQKQFYLPEAHTDFVFAIVAEEFGLFGVVVVIGLFALLVSRILKISRKAIVDDKRFESFAAFGIAVLFAGQAFINIGVASGLLPTKGLTLPFISYGGSSLLMSCIFMGFLMRVDWEQRRPQPKKVMPASGTGRQKRVREFKERGNA